MARGVWYSRFLGDLNHPKLPIYGSREFIAQDQLASEGVVDEASYNQFCAEVENGLAGEVAQAKAANCHTFLISHEFLHSRIYRAPDVARVAGLCKRLFDEVAALFVLRKPSDLFISSINELVRFKSPVREGILSGVSPNNPYYDFVSLLTIWQNEVGTENVHVIPFSRVPGKNVLNALNGFLGLDMDIPREESAENESVDVRTLAIGNAVRSPRLIEGRVNPNTEFFMTGFPMREKLALGSEMAAELNRRFETSNRQLLKMFPDELEEGDLFADIGQGDESGNFHMLFGLMPYSEGLTFLVERFNRQVWFERARTAIIQARHARARARHTDAAMAAAQAREFIRNAEGDGLEQGLAELRRALDKEFPE